MSSEAHLVLTVELTERQAMALAQFVKRVGWTEFRGNAIDNDEAYLIREAVDAVQRELRVQGYSPR
jgi:hypothetical protein